MNRKTNITAITMVKNVMTILAMLVASCLTACPQGNRKAAKGGTKALVVYFSATGTTRAVAVRLAAAAKADLLEIEPEVPYTDADLDWRDKESRSTVEMHDPGFRPGIKKPGKDAAGYDVVFIGFPIWWDMAPTVVNTYIEAARLKGKTVVPFATSGGSGIENSAAQLKKAYPDIVWKKGRLLNGIPDEDIARWVKSLAL